MTSLRWLRPRRKRGIVARAVVPPIVHYRLYGHRACGLEPWATGTIYEPSDDDPFADAVTCPSCIRYLATVRREHCNAVSDEPGPLPARCSRRPHDDGDHDWVPGAEVRLRAQLQQNAVSTATRDAIAVPAATATPPASSPSDRLPAPKGEVRRVVSRWSV